MKTLTRYSEKQERDVDLYNAYKKVLSQVPHTATHKEILDLTVKQPAKRFYVSARVVCSALRSIQKGEVNRMSQERQALIGEVTKRVLAVLASGGSKRPLKHIVEEILDQPAPEFYIKSSSAKIILHYEKQKQKKLFEKSPMRYLKTTSTL